MPTDREIYNNHAETYQLMVSYEDVDGNLPRAINEIRPLAGLDVVEFGAGTGRVTRMLAPHARKVFVHDGSHHMLAEASRGFLAAHLYNTTLAVADNRAIPLKGGIADLAIEGWSFLYLATYHPGEWRKQFGSAIDEMARLVKPGGTIILIETLGTGKREPEPPIPLFGEVYNWLEAERGFSSRWVRTDFRFESPEQADDLITFFFGETAAAAMVTPGSPVVPECTGIWWRTV